MTILFAAARAAHFLALMTVFGAAAFKTLLDRQRLPGPPENWLRVFYLAAGAIAFVTAILWLVLASGRMTGDPSQLDWAAVKLVAAKTEFGRIAVWRIAGLLLLIMVTFIKSAPRLVAGLSAALLASLGLTSHAAAAAGPLPFLRASNDAVHLLTAGFWVGGLVLLAALTRRYYKQPQILAAPFRLFSRWGTVAVTLLIFTGIVNATSILPVRSISTANSYADILAVKIALALSMALLAVVNRLELVPSLSAGREKTGVQLGRSVMAEIFLGIVVIAIVGYLGLMAPN